MKTHEEDRIKEKAKKKRKLLTKKRKVVEPIQEKLVHEEKKRKKASSSKQTLSMQRFHDTPPPPSPPPVSPSPVKARGRGKSSKMIISEDSDDTSSSFETTPNRSPTRGRSDKKFKESDILSDNSLRIIKAKVNTYKSLDRRIKITLYYYLVEIY